MKFSSFLSGQKYLLSPARKMIAALFLFSALGSTAMGAASSITLTGPASVVAGTVSDLFTVTANSEVSDTTVLTLSTSDESGTATFNPISVSIAPGDVSATFTYMNTKVGDGTHTITATQSSGDPVGVATHDITVTAGAASKVTLTGPVSVIAGAVSANFTVTAYDANDNVAPVTLATVFTLAPDEESGTATFDPISGTFQINAAASSATFTYKNTKVGTGTHTITATRSSGDVVGVATHDITVTAGTATKVAFTTQPSASTVAGVAFAQQPVVKIQDANGNTVTTATDQVIITKTTGTGSLNGTMAMDAVAGVATFTDLSISLAGAKVLTATVSELTTADTSSFTITGPATKLAFTTQPSESTVAGVAFAQQPVVTIRDATDVTVGSATNPITLTLTTGTGTLSGTVTMSPVNGVSTFTDLSIDLAGADKVLTALATSLTPAETSPTFTIVAAAASQLAITTQPVGGASGAALATQPKIEIRDALGNLVDDDTTVVTVGIKTGAGGTLGGDVDIMAVNGVVTFADVTLAGTVLTDYVLTFTSSPVLTAADSGNVRVTVGAANKLAITTQPVGFTNGATLATQPIIQIQDAKGNLVDDDTTVVTAAIFSGDGGTLGGTTNITAAAGVAIYTNLTMAGTVGSNYVLRFTSDPVLTAADSIDVTVKLAPVPTSLTFQQVYKEAAPAAQTFNLAVPGDVSPTAYALSTNQTWLIAMDSTGGVAGVIDTLANTNITVTVSPTEILTVGRHIGIVTNGASWLDVAVNLDVVLRPSSTNLTVNARYGDTAPIVTTFVLTVPDDVSETAYLLGTNVSWLSVSNAAGGVSGMIPTSGTTNITVTILPGELPVGTARGMITVSNWLTVAVDVIVGKGNVEITFSDTNLVYNGLAREVSATSVPANDVSVTYVGNPWAPTNVGTYAVTGIVNTANYQGTGTTTLTVSKGVPTVTNWGTATDINYGQMLSASTLSGVGATNSVGTPVPGSNTFVAPTARPNAGITNTLVIFTPNDAANYTNALAPDTVAVTVNKATPTMTWGTAGAITYGQPLSASTLSGFSATNIDLGADVGGIFAFADPTAVPNAGTAGHLVNFTVTDTANYSNTANTVTVTVDKAAQTITFAAIPDQVVSNVVTLSASASPSSLAVSFAVADGPGVITGGTTLKFTAAGTVSIVASQAGNSNFLSAETVTRSFNVAGKAAQTITFAAITDKVVSNVVTLSATANSGLTVTFSVDGPAVITGNQLTFTGVGVASIIASQTGDVTWAAATPVTRTFNVAKAAQTITFAAIADQEVGSVVTLGATASSGLTVSYGATGPAVITGSQLTFTGTGAVTIVASQSGNANWNAATSVTRTFNVGLNRYVEGDFDGDGLADPYWPMKADVPGLWTIWLSEGGAYLPNGPYAMSVPGGEPVRVADFDGDGLADPVMVADGKWYIWLSSSGGEAPKGPSFTMPVPSGEVDWVAADFDGDGKADPAMVVNGSWTVWFSADRYQLSGPYVMSVPDGVPVAADFDGDRKADPAMVANGNWTFWFSEGGLYLQSDPIVMSVPGTDPVPMVGDFDGDRKADPAMVVNNNWTIWLSGGGKYLPQGPFQFVP